MYKIEHSPLYLYGCEQLGVSSASRMTSRERSMGAVTQFPMLAVLNGVFRQGRANYIKNIQITNYYAVLSELRDQLHT